MKQFQPQATLPLVVSPPAETLRDTVGERRAASLHGDPKLHWQHAPGAPDFRPQVASGGALQRIRARQTEARTARLCHVRVHRRTQAVT